MKLRAVLCDIYKTLLEVGPPPVDAELRWRQLCAASFPHGSAPTLVGFARATEQVIAREHAAARAVGLAFPEIYWPAVACAGWPALAGLAASQLDDFLFAHAQLQRTVRLMPGAADVLRRCGQGDWLLGIVSNSQPYTWRELDAALATAGLSRALFAPDLCFLSFAHGFSKPDPHVFRFLTARLAARGVSPAAAIVVGDRADNDIVPARAAGFRTWRLVAAPGGEALAGGWAALGEWMTTSDRGTPGAAGPA